MDLETKTLNLKSVEIDGIDMNDYPDFVDAFISYAEYEDGTELTEQELDSLQENNPDWVYELTLAKVF